MCTYDTLKLILVAFVHFLSFTLPLILQQYSRKLTFFTRGVFFVVRTCQVKFKFPESEVIIFPTAHEGSIKAILVPHWIQFM